MLRNFMKIHGIVSKKKLFLSNLKECFKLTKHTNLEVNIWGILLTLKTEHLRKKS